MIGLDYYVNYHNAVIMKMNELITDLKYSSFDYQGVVNPQWNSSEFN